MFISWRGYEGKDAPQHLIMGKKTVDLLKQLEIPTVVLSKDFKEEVRHAVKTMDEESIPVAVILKKEIVG